jgi:hypothetical protein
MNMLGINSHDNIVHLKQKLKGNKKHKEATTGQEILKFYGRLHSCYKV